MATVSRTCRLFGTCMLILSASHPVFAQQAGAGPGLKVGAPAPNFTLPDQQGQPQELAQLLKQGKLAIVFYRSADW